MPTRGPVRVLRWWRELRRRRPVWLAVAGFAATFAVVAVLMQALHLRGW
jgi:hypothetical protein